MEPPGNGKGQCTKWRSQCNPVYEVNRAAAEVAIRT